jgi:CubicO group peptidase (beta-lactamase class C family)
VTARPLEAAPGQRFAYNQTNYVLLARIIAQQSGMSYERFLATRQFSSARMARTTFGDSYDLIPDAATMYSLAPRATDAVDAPSRLSHWFYDIPPSLWAGGGILTTADDTARWLVALTEGRLLPETALRRMWSAERLADGAPARGQVAGGARASPDLQVAGIGGARSAFVVYPERGVAVVVLTNLVGANPQQFIPRIADFYARDASTPVTNGSALHGSNGLSSQAIARRERPWPLRSDPGSSAGNRRGWHCHGRSCVHRRPVAVRGRLRPPSAALALCPARR